MGNDALPALPKSHCMDFYKDDCEKCAKQMRKYLNLAESGPIGNLINILENNGILVYLYDECDDNFYGMNGTVNNRPYIIINGNMHSERIRSTIAHEMAHFIFKWPENMEEKEIEEYATAISGAFLFPKVDAIRELGVKRNAITKEMDIT